MANDYRHLLVGFLLFGVFLTLVITPIIAISQNYGIDDVKVDDATGGALDVSDYQDEVIGTDGNSLDEDLENARERFESGDVNDVDDPSGIFSVIGNVIEIIFTPFTLLAKIMENTFGLPQVFGLMILGIINLYLILATWRVIRQGD